MDKTENTRVKKKHIIVGSIVAVVVLGLIFVLVNLGRISNTLLMSANGIIRTINGTYSGDLNSGEITGSGTLTFNSGEIYTGEMLAAKLNGLGKLEFPDIGTYSGEFAESMRNGEGAFIWEDGSSYSGTWVNDKVNGTGTITFADGSVLEGEFRDGVLSSGTYTAINGDKYVYNIVSTGLYKVTVTTANGTFEGEYKEGIYSGTVTFKNGDVYTGDLDETNYVNSGKYVWADGHSSDCIFGEDGTITSGKISFSDGGYYEGELSNSAFNGEGTYTWPTGATYSGNWDDGIINGNGKYTLASGEVFSGSFEVGTLVSGTEAVENENAKYVFTITNSAYTNTISIDYADGTKYFGEYSDGAINGQGQMNYGNGDTYSGEFKSGLKSGTGTYSWADGDKYVGSWSKDKMHGKGIYYIGGSSTEYFEGKFSDNVPTGNIKYSTGGRIYTTHWSNGKCTSIK